MSPVQCVWMSLQRVLTSKFFLAVIFIMSIVLMNGFAIIARSALFVRPTYVKQAANEGTRMIQCHQMILVVPLVVYYPSIETMVLFTGDYLFY